MSHLQVNGGARLRGEVRPSANKNAVLPILCATLLTREPVTLHRVPNITDARKLLEFFRSLGSSIQGTLEQGTITLHHDRLAFDERRQSLPGQMRSSVMLVPPMLSRFGAARIESDVKGCTLGVREIDPHVEMLRRFGAAFEFNDDAILVRADRRFQATDHWLEYASVTTTEGFVMAAAVAEGESTLVNAACEPHVQECLEFISRMGGVIDGIGTSRLRITGVSRLHGCEFTFADDFHEVATFIALGAMTGGNVRVKNDSPRHFPLIDRTFAKFGVEVRHDDGWTTAEAAPQLRVLPPLTTNLLQKVEAAPWPYVPADLLPIFVALGVAAEGPMLFWNKVYDGALGWTAERGKFGAHVVMSDPHRVITFGGKPLVPARVESPYIIRVAIALLMVAASIPGRSTICNADPIRRAHPDFVENLARLGLDIAWVEG